MRVILLLVLVTICSCHRSKLKKDTEITIDSLSFIYIEDMILTPVAVTCDRIERFFLEDHVKHKTIIDKESIQDVNKKLEELIEKEESSFDTRMKVKLYSNGEILSSFCCSRNTIWMNGVYYEFDPEFRKLIFDLIGIEDQPHM